MQVSDLTDTECVTLCILLINYKPYYATHKNDVGKIATSVCIRLEPNAQIITQRPSQVPILYPDKPNALLTELKEREKHNHNK